MLFPMHFFPCLSGKFIAFHLLLLLSVYIEDPRNTAELGLDLDGRMPVQDTQKSCKSMARGKCILNSLSMGTE